jgi:hypothetical protein
VWEQLRYILDTSPKNKEVVRKRLSARAEARLQELRHQGWSW